MATTRRLYWDSQCFIAWPATEADKVDDCRTVIRAAERGDLVIVTSSLSIDEEVKLRDHSPVPVRAPRFRSDDGALRASGGLAIRD